MALTVPQQPLISLCPVGQDLIYTATDPAAVASHFNVKYIAEVHMSVDPINLSFAGDIIGIFKTSPNDAGVGMFNLRTVVESFVNPDNIAIGSRYKTGTPPLMPVHLIDSYALNQNIVRYLKIRFRVEGSTTPGGTVLLIDNYDSNELTIFNGYLKATDTLLEYNDSFGYDSSKFYLNPILVAGDVPGRWLTNAPLIQYANNTDYGTISVISTELSTDASLDQMALNYYDSSGVQLGSDIIDNTNANGGYSTYTTESKNQLMHFGCYPGNLRNWASWFQTNFESVAYYIVAGVNLSVGDNITETLRINLRCTNLKGFEPIRLTWLNQWGVWDYYTFNMKSTKSISTKGSTYQQIEGTWNESTYKINGFKGGKKSFRVNATEKISMNTDFVSEAESEWFEELINSPEVYILEGYKYESATSIAFNSFNTYVIPVRLTTSSFTRKTIANDKLMQYTFEVEKSKTLRTQSV